MHLSSLLEAFLRLIPDRLPSPDSLHSSTAFTRRRKLPLPTLVVLLLFLTASGKSQGVDGAKSGRCSDRRAVVGSGQTRKPSIAVR